MFGPSPAAATPADDVAAALGVRALDGAGNNLQHPEWGFAWAQFMDHTIGLRQEVGGERAPIAFELHDPLEGFRNDFGAIDFSRTPAAPRIGGAGVVREQINTVSSLIDGWSVYGGTDQRLEWLREGPVNSDLRDNGARLLLDGGLLPRRSSRGDVVAAPEMALQGGLAATPQKAVAAGDAVRTGNYAKTLTYTLSTTAPVSTHSGP
jgi:hypothetical protein